MVDEMDLASQALDVTPWRPEQYERARAALRGAMAESAAQPQAAPAPTVISWQEKGSSRMGSRRRKSMGTKGKIGIGAGIGAIAAAVAAILVVTSTPQPATSTPQASTPTGSASRASTTSSPLMTLAAHISAESSPVPGDASLVIAHKYLGSKMVEVVYALYTDGGAMYLGGDQKGLTQEVVKNENQEVGFPEGKEVAAARYAASGDLATARKMMEVANSGNDDDYLSYAARKKIWDKKLPALKAILRMKGSKVVPPMPNGQVLTDDINNSIFNGCLDALQWSAADPQARAGVMRLLASVPDLTIVRSKTDGQPTLTITTGPAHFDNFTQVLKVNAETGLQVSFVSSAPGVTTGGEIDKDSRVTVANIRAGKY